MKSCSKIEELMSLYVDDMLESSELEEFEEHILSCVSCRNELDKLKLTIQCCKDISNEDIPIGFKETLYERLTDEKLLCFKDTADGKLKLEKVKNKYLIVFTSIAAAIFAFILIWGVTGNIHMQNNKTKASPYTALNDSKANSSEKIGKRSNEEKSDAPLKAGGQNTSSDNGQISEYDKGKVLDGAYQKNKSGELAKLNDGKPQKDPNTDKKKNEDLKEGSDATEYVTQRNDETALKQVLSDEPVINRSTDITVFSSDIKFGTDAITKIVADNGGNINSKPTSGLNMVASDKASNKENENPIAPSQHSVKALKDDEVLIEARIPNSQITSFEEAISKNKATVKFNDIINTDVTQNIKELNKRLNDINIKINDINKGDYTFNRNASVKTELDSLQMEKGEIQSKIDEFNDNSNYVTVFITIKKQK